MAGKKFLNFRWSRFLIIVQNVNMVTNGKRNSRLNPNRHPGNGNVGSHLTVMEEGFFNKKFTNKMHENMSPNNECVLWTGCTKGRIVKYGVINCRLRCGYSRDVTVTG